MQQNPYQPPNSPHGPPPGWGQPGPRPNQDLELVVPINVAPLALIAGYVGFGAVFCLPAPLALGLGTLRSRTSRNARIGPVRAGRGLRS